MKQCMDCSNFFVDCVGIYGGKFGTCINDPIQNEGLGLRDGRTTACRLLQEVTHDRAGSDDDSIYASHQLSAG